MEQPESEDSEDGAQPDNEDSRLKEADGKNEEGEESDHWEELRESVTVEEEEWFTASEDEGQEEEDIVGKSNETPFRNSTRLLHKDELLEMFKMVHNGPRCKEGQLTVGLVCAFFQPICCVLSF